MKSSVDIRIIRLFKCMILTVFALLFVMGSSLFVFAADEIVYTDSGKAASYIKSNLLNRNSSFTFTYDIKDETLSLGSGETAESVLKKRSYVKEAKSMLATCFEHTGKADEGDYLGNSISSYNIKTSVSYTNNGSSLLVSRIKYTFTVNYYTTKAQEVTFKTKEAEVIKKLNMSSKTEYEKICEIYSFITENVDYDELNLNNAAYQLKQSAYAALVNKTAVCQGYASLLYHMALNCGLDCRIIKGISNNASGVAESHAWNMVRIGDKYYYVDATWDADSNEYKYFLNGKGDFNNHSNYYLNSLDEEISPEKVYKVASNSYYNGLSRSEINGASINVKSAVYNGKNVDFDIDVILNGVKLKKGIDYKITYYLVSDSSGKIKKGVLNITGVGLYQSSIGNIDFPVTESKEAASKDVEVNENVVVANFGGKLKKNSVYAIGNNKYKVTKLGNNGTMTYLAAKESAKKVVIPDKVIINKEEYKVTVIAAKAFKNDKKLKSISIGTNVKKIGAQAFYNCKNLKTVKVRSTVLKKCGSKAFKGTPKKLKAYTAKKKIKKYRKMFRKAGLNKKARFKTLK